MDQQGFQLYLLAHMKAAELVDHALRASGATPNQMRSALHEGLALGFETPGHSAGLYRHVLGPPIEVTTLDLSPSSPFAHSSALKFRLPLWPRLDYVVHEHPSGYAWNPGFQRAKGCSTPALEIAADLRPFDLVIEEVTNRFGNPTTMDAWTNWEVLSYDIPDVPGGPTRRRTLCFDFRLLQTVDDSLTVDSVRHMPPRPSSR